MNKELQELDLQLSAFNIPDLSIYNFPKIELNESFILGLDMSFTGTGVCLLNVEEAQLNTALLTPRVAKGPKNVAKGRHRIRLYTRVIENLLLRFRPRYVALEGYSFGSKTAAYDLGELGGHIRNLLDEYFEAQGLDPMEHYITPPPTTLKKFVAGKGNVNKNLMLLELYSRFGIKADNDNICDAVAVSLFYFKKLYPKLFKTWFPEA